MAIGDRYSLYHKYTLLGQECMNHFVYEQIDGPGGAGDLAIAYGLDIFPEFKDVQSVSAVTTEFQVINHDDDSDFSTLSCTVGCAGTVAGDPLPPFVSWAFRKNRGTRASRNGQLRIAGVTEAHTLDGAATAAALTLLNNLATALSANISNGEQGTWTLRIPRFGALGALVAVFPISSVGYVRLSTQNTRKPGRGS